MQLVNQTGEALGTISEQVAAINEHIASIATAVMHKLSGSARSLTGMVDRFDIGSARGAGQAGGRMSRAA